MQRLLTLLLALALLGAACSSDAETTSAAPAETDADGESSEEASSDSASAESDSADRASAAEGVSAGETSSGEEASSESEAPAADLDVVEPATVPPATSTTIVQPPSQAGTLTAGDIDDNLNITFFSEYLERTSSIYELQGLPVVSIDDRVTINIVDPSGEPVPNALVSITSGQERVSLTANAYGTAYLFPGHVGLSEQWNSLEVLASGPAQDQAQRATIRPGDLDDDNAVSIAVDAQALRPDGLDIALVIDTTGSMGDELSYLTTEFTSIVGRLSNEYPGVDMRFALVVYRDQGDDYVSESYAFTGDVAEIQDSLNQQFAEGGGDYPEAMDVALDDALDLDWRTGNVAKVLILNADAPPHDRDFEAVLALSAEARERGIRIYPLAASGVGDAAEYLMRVMAATTGGRHLFLTDDSGVGLAHQEPKVQCYVVSRLDHLVIRILSSELSTTRIEPLPNQLIRTVGNYDNGYCTDEQ